VNPLASPNLDPLSSCYLQSESPFQWSGTRVFVTGTHLRYGGETWFGKRNIKTEGYAFPTVFIFRKRFQHVTQALLSQQYGPKKYVNYQVQIRVFALPTITTASGLRCCSKGAVSCPRSYQFWTLLSRHRTFMGKAPSGSIGSQVLGFLRNVFTELCTRLHASFEFILGCRSYFRV
jgi:hypothetical protein